MLNRYSKSPTRPYIILADDDEDDCMFFKDAFNELKLNLQLVIVKNGEELMDFLAGIPCLLPKLLFLDLNMPRKNGFECLRDLKESERFKGIPVIVYSTSNSFYDYEKCLELKAHVYVTKPNCFIELKKIINKVLVTDFVNHLVEQPKRRPLVFSVE